jgi:peroxiredoxin Q/BCP
MARAAATSPIAEGRKAPAFTLKDAKGRSVSLADFAGRHVVVYFYPRDDTPGCTKEACGFRDHWSEIRRRGAVVLGISPDGPEAHAKFAARYELPFALLCDPDKKVMEKYGAWGKKILYGKPSVGVIRSTVLVGPDGKVIRHWKKVANAAEHPEQVLEVLRAQK